MIELDKNALDYINGGFGFGVPTSCYITVACYAAAKFFLSDEPITEEGLLASAFFGLILDTGELIG